MSSLLRVSQFSSADQLADALTKPLSRTRLKLLMDKIGVTTSAPSVGGIYIIGYICTSYISLCPILNSYTYFLVIQLCIYIYISDSIVNKIH